MNKIRIIGTAFLCLIASTMAFAQSETSAMRIGASPNTNTGSSRYQAMAGSMGAVGAEYSAININPASIGLFRSNGKISVTTSFVNPIEQTDWYNSSNKQKNNFNVKFDELSYMSSWNKSMGIGFSFGFGVQRGASFDRNINIGANIGGVGTSMADYLAASINRYKGKEKAILDDAFKGNGAYSRYPWLMVMGVRDGWVRSSHKAGLLYLTNFKANAGSNYSAGLGADFQLKEKGQSMKYNFSTSFDIGGNVNLGLVANLTSVRYELATMFREDHKDKEYLKFSNSVQVKGSGLDIGVGIIAEPISGLRIGGAIFSPTYYSFTQDYTANAEANVDGYYHQDYTPDDGGSEFEVSSPWRFTLSGAYVFGKRAILNVDYELSLLGSTRMDNSNESSSSNIYDIDNSAIKEDFGIRNSIRVGGELNVTNRFTLRGGFAYTSSGVSSDLVENGIPTRELLVDGISPSYTLVDNYKTIAGGFGYKLTPNWALDISFADHITSANVFTFPVINDPATKWEGEALGKLNPKETFLEGYKSIDYKEHLLRGSVSLSYRF